MIQNAKVELSPRSRDRIIAVVISTLETEGYERVQLREVARRSHVSLETIYQQFGNKAQLIIDALQEWMGVNSYSVRRAPEAHESLYDGLMGNLRQVFEPWERSPTMLKAFYQAQAGPGGDHLKQQGRSAMEPNGREVMKGLEPSLAADIALILEGLALGAIGRFARGEIEVTDILHTLERAVYRLASLAE